MQKRSVFGVMVALLTAVFAFQLNASMLSPALKTMALELQANDAQIGVTQTAFFAAAALFSLFLPRWGDLIGRKKVMLGMLALTGVGCVVSALAFNVALLGVGRIIQGVAGPMVPLALIVLHQEVPDPKRYATLMAILTSVNGGIAGVDALLGGWLAGSFGFRSVFLFMATICLIAFIAVLACTRESFSSQGTPMDWPGVFSLLVLFGCIYFAFNELGKLSDARWWLIAVEIIVAGVSAIVFWKIESHKASPLVSTHYLKQRRTWALLSTTFLTMTGVFAVMNGLIPNLAQTPSPVGLGLDAQSVSFVTLTPYAIMGLVMGPIAGHMASRWGYNRVLKAGLGLTIVFLIGGFLVADRPSALLVFLVCVGVGISYAGIANIMLNGIGIVLSPRDNQGYLPGMNSGAFNLGAGLSFAILTAIQTIVMQSTANETLGYRCAIITGAILVIAAFCMSLLIPAHSEEVAES